MNTVTVIIIAIIVLYLIFAVLAAIFRGLAEILGQIINGFKKSASYLFGKKFLKRKVKIPNELLPDSKPLPSEDTQCIRLKNYHPSPAYITPSEAIQFKSDSGCLLNPHTEKTKRFYIEELSNILVLTTPKCYEHFFDILNQDPHYPGPKPQKPQKVTPPPKWEEWEIQCDTPSFDKPRWPFLLGFLNNFVNKAYKDEIASFKSAKEKHENLINQCKNRNQKAQELAIKAKKLHEHAESEQARKYSDQLKQYQKDAENYIRAFKAEQDRIKKVKNYTNRRGKQGLLARIKFHTRCMKLPDSISNISQTTFDEESGVLIHDHRFPDSSAIEWIKWVQLKAGPTKKPTNQKEKKQALKDLFPSLCLRLLMEINNLDEENIIKAIALNGWTEFHEKTTGQLKKAYCASIYAKKDQIQKLELSTLDPEIAFNSLKGRSTKTLEITPVAPIVRFDTNDPRFVDSKEILEGIEKDENLALMDWEDFEHLCRELFEKAFASSCAEVKVTQASRDKGVDAVIFDPDPLRGGKIIIQAKRYTNIVDVSAVRDLYGAVLNEGAIKGILVTTSKYGSEAYSFAKDKPLTLLNGQELLSLLEKHGYNFRIDLIEAKSMA